MGELIDLSLVDLSLTLALVAVLFGISAHQRYGLEGTVDAIVKSTERADGKIMVFPN